MVLSHLQRVGGTPHASLPEQAFAEAPIASLWPLTWAPRKLLINSPLLADTIAAPRVPLYG